MAGPEFELAGTLVDEHFRAGDGLEALGAGEGEERGQGGIVDGVEDEGGVELVCFEGQGEGITAHAGRGGVDEDVEVLVGEGLAGEGYGGGVVGQGISLFLGAVIEKHVGALDFAGEDGGPGSAARAEDEDAGVFEREALLEREDDAGGVGVVAMPLAAWGAVDGVDGADAGGEGVDVVEEGEDGLF